LCCIASFIVSFNSSKFAQFAFFANLAQAFFASSIGLSGVVILPSGVVLVFAQTGVVGLA
jgi:hypothetical protein